MTRRRILLVALLSIPWLLAAAVGLEFMQSVLDRRAESRGETYGRDVAAKAAAECQQPAAPAGIGERRELLALDDPERLKRAGERQELILVCAPDGRIRNSYPGSSAPQAATVTRLLTSSGSIVGLLPAVEEGDALAALNSALAGKTHQIRDYDIPLPGGDRWISEWLFLPASEDAKECAVFIRDSMWQEMWKKFRPNVRRNDIFEFSTNSRGFRDEEVALPKPPGVCRIVCIGGSTTAEGPTNVWTYPNLLEARLRAMFGTDRIEVVNCGVFALASAGERERADDYFALEPDLAVHCNFVNDVTYNAPGWATGGAGQSAWMTALKQWARKSRFVYARANRWLLPSDDLLEAELRRTTFSNMAALLEVGQKQGCSVVFSTFACPDVAGMNAAELHFFNRQINTMIWGAAMNFETYAGLVGLYNRVLKQWCAENGVPCIDVAARFSGGAELFSDICHVRPCAMEKKANAFAEELRPFVEKILAQKKSAGP